MDVLGQLDLRSLAIATIVASVPLVVLCGFASRLAPELRGPSEWVRAGGCIIVALLLYVVAGAKAIPSSTADVLALVALFLLGAGVDGTPAERTARRRGEVGATVLLASWLLWFSLVEPRPQLRAVGASSALALAALRVGYGIITQTARPPLLRWAGAVVFAAMAAGLAYRAVAVWLQGPQPAHSLALGESATLPMLLTLFAVVGGSTALLAMSGSQLLANYRATQDRLEKLVLVDGLTGVANRRALFETLQRRTADARRNGRPLSLVLLDVDRFKSINDGIGHAGGDAALRAVAERLAAELREIDLCARFGGEEFVVLLPETAAEEAERVAERLRRSLAELRPLGSAAPPLTASFGVASWRPEDGDGSGLVARADELMYRAKRAGGDRVAVQPAATPA